ncbi:alpha/beta fold hydrolase [Spirochaeta cellobiosiphila]|uniref:alpha/beta fold hydrolase n=1 Tax=Spirochaeta cellobiosiphila TaxID=504483 RepID=UPI00042416DE|nr:alpha/beta hydrolase [Spirochaeta cellobiosiphila]
MFFDSTYGKIYYDIQGEGPDLVLLHGTPFSSAVWSEILKELKPYYRIYIYDLLGYGQSEKVGNVSLDIQNKAFVELMLYWNLQSPYAVAHDFGGATLLRSIIINQLAISKMLLFDVVALSPWGSPFVKHVKHHEEVFNQIPNYIHKAMVQAYIRDALYKPFTDEDLDILVEPWLGEEGKKAFYRQIAQMDQKYTDDIREGLANINIPTHILWAEQDNWIPIEKGRELAQLIPSASFTGVSSSNHLMQWDQPQVILKAIRDFLPSYE